MELQELKNKITELTDNYDFDYVVKDNLYYLEQISDSDEFVDKIYEAIDEQEIIYYSDGLDYLREHDVSLLDSMELAREYGYDATMLNSCVLATILRADLWREEFAGIATEIKDLIDEYLENKED